MLRRQVISHNRNHDHQGTPYKQRTYLPAPTYTGDTVLYGRKLENPLSAFDELDPTLQKWVGKKIIENGEAPIMNNDVVLEVEIAKYCRPHIYRIVYTGNPDIMTADLNDKIIGMRSRPNIDYRPARLNVFVNSDGKIIGFGYF